MPYYKDNTYFTQINPLSHPDFDVDFPVGKKTPVASIYRCMTCGHEIGVAKDHVLPPEGKEGHPTHPYYPGQTLLGSTAPTQWRLVA
ncbi:hypothetical protein [Komagataeibacter rhaeticus]|uniref:hypothetical protein n=1 Tax=Komagataeibacter rhaeticus TaxID=215221 RepID=UPI0039ECD2AC